MRFCPTLPHLKLKPPTHPSFRGYTEDGLKRRYEDWAKDGATFFGTHSNSPLACRCSTPECKKMATAIVNREAFCNRCGSRAYSGKEPPPEPNKEERTRMRAMFKAMNLMSEYGVGRQEGGRHISIIMDKDYLIKLAKLTEHFYKHRRKKPPKDILGIISH